MTPDRPTIRRFAAFALGCLLLLAGALPGQAAPEQALMIAGDLDSVEATLLESQLRARLRELDAAGAFRGLTGFRKGFLVYNHGVPEHQGLLGWLRVGRPKAPALLVVELGYGGEPSRVLWGKKVDDVEAALADLARFLAIGLPPARPSATASRGGARGPGWHEITIFTDPARGFDASELAFIEELRAAGFRVDAEPGGGGTNPDSNVKVARGQEATAAVVQGIAARHFEAREGDFSILPIFEADDPDLFVNLGPYAAMATGGAPGPATGGWTLDDSVALLGELGCSGIERVGEDTVRFQSVSGEWAMLLIHHEYGLQTYWAVGGGGASLDQVNEWNKTHRLSKAYVDHEGDPVVESDLLHESTATREKVSTFLRVFMVSVDQFYGSITGEEK